MNVGVPIGVPNAVRISTAAKILKLKERTVRGWVDAGKLECLPYKKNEWRLISTGVLARLAYVSGLELDWLAALE